MRKLKLGVVGLGRAFALMAPTLMRDKRVELVGAVDPRPEALDKFKQDFGGRGFANLEALLKSDAEAVYIATPHERHAEQAVAAAAAGKHVLVEKPMALSLEECRAIAAAAKQHDVFLVVGHSHSFDRPILETRKLIDSGEFGRVRMISALNYTDFLYRPRRPEELENAVLNQSAHHVDVVRLLSRSRLKSVRAQTGNWDPARPAEGAYAALLTFEESFATIVYSGYARFDSDELMGWIGEGGQKKDPAQYGAARKNLAQRKESLLKAARNYGGAEFKANEAVQHPHFGLIVVSCDKADLRPLPGGVMIHADGEQRLEPLAPPAVPRAGVIDELYDAVVNGKAPLHDALWGLATTQACLAILESAHTGKEVSLRHPTSASRT
ncbi:MAG: phthalate 4,5-cis-dihydrodiol dehydrogenase [Betaproteobacteria bacterium]|jgi:phthalate 4,5-cis-dihydrodiol dehydrogenase|nr:phthalate 4,5-cis-dihydrodiol dehydrogenase [Betaproteobacteria bacterium]